MGALPVNILISKCIIVPVRKVRKKIARKLKTALPFSSILAEVFWEHDEVLVCANAEDLCRVPAG